MSTKAQQGPTPRVPPLVPLALAVLAGVVADRAGVPWGTATWGRIALGAVTVIAFGAHRHGWAWEVALLVAVAALGAGWHHHRWSDMARDDLAWSVSETPRPAWVRGVVWEVLGHRPGASPGDRGTTR